VSYKGCWFPKFQKNETKTARLLGRELKKMRIGLAVPQKVHDHDLLQSECAEKAV
jgi:hypothetical protein